MARATPVSPGPEPEDLVRFVGDTVDPDSEQREGLFQLAFRIHAEGKLDVTELEQLCANLDWLTEHLEAPRRLSPFRNALRRGRSRTSRREPIAISWFKSTATEHLARARAIVATLKLAGFVLEEVRTTRPGYVTHEDEFQVVAVPFRGD